MVKGSSLWKFSPLWSMVRPKIRNIRKYSNFECPNSWNPCPWAKIVYVKIQFPMTNGIDVICINSEKIELRKSEYPNSWKLRPWSEDCLCKNSVPYDHWYGHYLQKFEKIWTSSFEYPNSWKLQSWSKIQSPMTTGTAVICKYSAVLSSGTAVYKN